MADANFRILKDLDENGVPQFLGADGKPKVLVGGRAPYSQVINESGHILFGSTNPGAVTITNKVQVSTDSPFSMKLEETAIVLPVELRGLEKVFLFATVANLAANAVYISPTYNLGTAKGVVGLASANVAGIIYIQESNDQSTWYNTSKIDVAASTATTISGVAYNDATSFNASLSSKYVRIVYVNGAAAQTRFSLHAHSVSN